MGNKTIKLKKWNFPKLIFWAFLLVIIILYVQFCYLSLSSKVYGKDLVEFAANRNTVKNVLIAKRGNVYDSEGNVLASNVNSYKLIAVLDSSKTIDDDNPKHVVDKKLTAEKLSSLIGADYEYVFDRLNQDKAQVEFGNYGRNITELQKIAIEKLELPGIIFEQTTTRYYPNGDFASYIIGYAKSDDNGVISGKLGIELEFNDILTGKDGYYMYQQDKYENKIPDTPETRVDSVDGSDIYLTIDSNIQRFAESAIMDISENYSPDWAMIVAMDAKTGEILASATDPSYNPNSIPADMTYQNPVTSYAFEPGSTMKIYTYMCAMENNLYDGTDTYLSGEYKINDSITVHDWNDVGWGTIDYDTGFKYSSNVGIINLINKGFKFEYLSDCLEKYGFGSTTGIDLPNEHKGSITYNYKTDLYSAGYGQSITTTALQHLQALSIIANDGVMVTPYIVEKIVSSTGEETITETKVSSKLVKQSTVNKIKDLMYNVVQDTDGTGHTYYLEGYDIIAKTGTAQISHNGSYMTGYSDYILSVSMMYPKDDPEIIIYAAAKRPSVPSSRVLADPLKEMIESISKYKNMNTGVSNEDEIKVYELDSFVNKTTNDIELELENWKINSIILGSGTKIINQYPKKGNAVIAGDKVILLTNDRTIYMPNIVGWSRSDVIALCDLLNVEYEITGNGFVTNQSIKKGTLVTDQKLSVTLEDDIEVSTTSE